MDAVSPDILVLLSELTNSLLVGRATVGSGWSRCRMEIVRWLTCQSLDEIQKFVACPGIIRRFAGYHTPTNSETIEPP